MKITPDTMLGVFVGRRDRVGVSSRNSLPVLNGDLRKFLDNHLNGTERLGFYNMLDGDVVRFAVLDFDSHGAKEPEEKERMDQHASRCQVELLRAGIWCYREISKSGIGNYHIWLFFSEAIPAEFIRQILNRFLLHLFRDDSSFKVELFPKQDRLTENGVGNFVWLPFFPPDVKEKRTVFIDSEGKLIEPEFRTNTEADLRRFAKQFDDEPPVTRQATEQRRSYSDILVNGVSVGERNNSIARLAGHFKRKGIPQCEVTAIVQIWNETLSEPLPHKEIERTVQSIFRYESPTNSQLIRYYSGTEMLTSTPIESRYIWEHLIKEESINFLVGETGCGKSMLAMNLAISLALGREEFLGFKTLNAEKVLFLNNELPFYDLQQRYLKMLSMLGDSLHGLDNLLVPEEVPPLVEYMDELHSRCEDFKPKLIILDCLYWSHSLKENDSTEMKQLMQEVKSLVRLHKLAVLIIHHTKKGVRYSRMGTDNARGSGILADVSDTLIELRRSGRKEEERLFKPAKLRNAPDTQRRVQLLSLDEETLWFRNEGGTTEEEHLPEVIPQKSARDEIEFSRILQQGELLTRKEIVERCRPLGYAERTIDRLLEKAKDCGKVKSPKYGKYSL